MVWEALVLFVSEWKHPMEAFRNDILAQRGTEYTQATHSKGAQLDSCIGFIDCTNIDMQRPGGVSLIKGLIIATTSASMHSSIKV